MRMRAVTRDRARVAMVAAAGVVTAGVAVAIGGTGSSQAAAVRSAVVAGSAAAQRHSERVLFDGGREAVGGVKYHSFRIPAVVRTKKNTVLAFAEGRVKGSADYGDIDLVYKRSTNSGASWSSLRRVVGSGAGTWGNPTPVADLRTGRIWLFMSWNSAHYSETGGHGTTRITQWGQRKVYLSSSRDDGLTWSKPVDMTAKLKPKKLANGKTWAWDAVGPGTGIQTTVSHPGRLIAPAQFRNIYSDDSGRTWKVRRIVHRSTKAYEEQTGESTIAELADGTLYRNDRPLKKYWATTKRRRVARGTIEGGFTAFAPDKALLEPTNGCGASTLRYNVGKPSRLVFLNSASTKTRTRMTVRISYNAGRTWPIARAFGDAPLPGQSSSYQEGGYSSMATLANHRIGALVEVNENVNSASSHRSIAFRTVDLSWILNGKREPSS
ncbi:sialidase family protein [Actinoallomurus vinaceus]|uniref:exo-alpha-sialidase n=2 Tax=Actinoallomurus vinaceus TaxID=1080074 RepID=A0ABP8U0E2_9ACTN